MCVEAGGTYRSLNSIVVQSKNSTIELKNVTTASDDTGTPVN